MKNLDCNERHCALHCIVAMALPTTQDWHITTLTPSNLGTKEKRVPTSSAVTQEEARRRKAAADDTEEVRHPTISKSAAQEIRELRTKKGWSQKQLAQAINEKPDVIKACEDGRILSNGALLVKIRRVLK